MDDLAYASVRCYTISNQILQFWAPVDRLANFLNLSVLNLAVNCSQLLSSQEREGTGERENESRRPTTHFNISIGTPIYTTTQTNP